MNQHLPIRTRDTPSAPGAVYLCPSVGEYPIYDAAIYKVLSDDERRNGLFRRAVSEAAPGATVLEIGCGPDLMWSLAAADAGAARVYAFEVIEDAARAAAHLALSRPQARVTVSAGDATLLTLPEPADLCIAEIIGCIGGSEGIAAVLADARRRHLVPSAAVIPTSVRTLAAAVSLFDLTRGDIALAAPLVPYAEAIFRLAGGPFDLRLYVGGAGPGALMSTAGCFEDLRLAEQSCTQGGELHLHVTRPGQVDGLLAWIELAVAADGEILNSLAEDTNWLPVYIPFGRLEPLSVSTGDTLSLTVTAACAADGIHPEYFFRGHLTRAGSGSTVALTAESRYSGGPFRSTMAHRALFPSGRLEPD